MVPEACSMTFIYSLKKPLTGANHIVNNYQGAATLEGLTGIVGADCFSNIKTY